MGTSDAESDSSDGGGFNFFGSNAGLVGKAYRLTASHPQPFF